MARTGSGVEAGVQFSDHWRTYSPAPRKCTLGTRCHGQNQCKDRLTSGAVT
jgi:hypothetical protein